MERTQIDRRTRHGSSPTKSVSERSKLVVGHQDEAGGTEDIT